MPCLLSASIKAFRLVEYVEAARASRLRTDLSASSRATMRCST